MSSYLRSLFTQLSPLAKQALLKIQDKIALKERITNGDVGLLGYNASMFPKNETAKAFGITQGTLDAWVNQGAPRNPDFTFNLPILYNWTKNRKGLGSGSDSPDGEEEESLKDQKTKKEIEKLEIVIAKLKDESVSREEMEAINAARASSLSTFLEKSGLKNLSVFANKTREELEPLWLDFVRRAMEAYSGDV